MESINARYRGQPIKVCVHYPNEAAPLKGLYLVTAPDQIDGGRARCAIRRKPAERVSDHLRGRRPRLQLNDETAGPHPRFVGQPLGLVITRYDVSGETS